jgi:hypothetical protein
MRLLLSITVSAVRQCQYDKKTKKVLSIVMQFECLQFDHPALVIIIYITKQKLLLSSYIYIFAYVTNSNNNDNN